MLAGLSGAGSDLFPSVYSPFSAVPHLWVQADLGLGRHDCVRAYMRLSPCWGNAATVRSARGPHFFWFPTILWCCALILRGQRPAPRHPGDTTGSSACVGAARSGLPFGRPCLAALYVPRARGGRRTIHFFVRHFGQPMRVAPSHRPRGSVANTLLCLFTPRASRCPDPLSRAARWIPKGSSKYVVCRSGGHSHSQQVLAVGSWRSVIADCRGVFFVGLPSGRASFSSHRLRRHFQLLPHAPLMPRRRALPPDGPGTIPQAL